MFWSKTSNAILCSGPGRQQENTGKSQEEGIRSFILYRERQLPSQQKDRVVIAVSRKDLYPCHKTTPGTGFSLHLCLLEAGVIFSLTKKTKKTNTASPDSLPDFVCIFCLASRVSLESWGSKDNQDWQDTQ